MPKFDGTMSISSIQNEATSIAHALIHADLPPTPERLMGLLWLAIGTIGDERPNQEEHKDRFLKVLTSLDIQWRDLGKN